ncbi:hypothetical protein ASPVEDRAFT_83393 [Aspergillus versicolor CBS 583.65]|uniref:Uncharacterized protein n=1 Tax=Aspergillus versicolor CBS 583.65 TaxID=1036611 RepID=A0A1L9PK18_ASPVE|nr:uncharacterized protein ASPVEDRAFT_83393 [Aspergillus versicolor CBS 583.65]OJJ01868.1 hypothetical protein ASPVEDRAFT_83393 [Aspergillus versicolor CBS 583.65]
MTPRLQNKVCIITGTGSSMGRAAALKFAQEGATIVGCDVSAPRASETETAVQAIGGNMISLAPCDLTMPEGCGRLVNFTIERFGRIDVLCINASMAYLEWRQGVPMEHCNNNYSQEYNLIHLMTGVARPHLKKTGGAVVNVGSIDGCVSPLPQGKTKQDILDLNCHLALRDRDAGIRVNYISPGKIGMFETDPLLRDPFRGDPMGKVMLGRCGRPEEVVAVACFLASSEASYITAADIKVDGGMTAW